MENSAVYQKQYKIEISDVDFNRQLKLSKLFSLFQDVASEAAERFGKGISTLASDYGVSWVLAKVRVEIIRYPNWNESILIETWPHKAKTLEFDRDFLVYDNDGNVIIKAISTWIIIDINTRRIKRTDSINILYPEVTREKAIDKEYEKLKSYNNPEMAYKKMIGYSDIDFNGHLNNSKYIDFITDCFTLESHRTYALKAIEVNFINEALPNETLVLNRDLSRFAQNIIYIEGNNENDGKIIFKALLEIAKR